MLLVFMISCSDESTILEDNVLQETTSLESRNDIRPSDENEPNRCCNYTYEILEKIEEGNCCVYTLLITNKARCPIDIMGFRGKLNKNPIYGTAELKVKVCGEGLVLNVIANNGWQSLYCGKIELANDCKEDDCCDPSNYTVYKNAYPVPDSGCCRYTFHIKINNPDCDYFIIGDLGAQKITEEEFFFDGGIVCSQKTRTIYLSTSESKADACQVYNYGPGADNLCNN